MQFRKWYFPTDEGVNYEILVGQKGPPRDESFGGVSGPPALPTATVFGGCSRSFLIFGLNQACGGSNESSESPE